jgi:hypothetical protein
MPISLPGGNVLNTQTFDLWTASAVRPTEVRIPLQSVDNLPGLPVLPETLLRMELMSHEFSVDLQEISQLVLSDLGATLQILRRAAREFDDPADRPTRIEDCISSLGVQACIRAAAQKTIASDARHRVVLEIWAHAQEVAQVCRESAAAIGTLHPDEAYLVGLTHALGSLPNILGWERWPSSLLRRERAASRLAECWSLPLCVQEFAHASDRSESNNPWVSLVSMAHQHVRRSSMPCSFYEGLGPRLQRP